MQNVKCEKMSLRVWRKRRRGNTRMVYEPNKVILRLKTLESKR